MPSDVALDFSFYGLEQTLVLAPKGWECSGLMATDGKYGITITNPADDHAVVLVNGGGAAAINNLSLACPFFPDAAKEAQTDFSWMKMNCAVPTGERVRQIDATDVEFIDAPGIAGTGALSGLAYPVYGIVHYDGGGASRVSCALPSASASLCKPVMDWFINNPF